MTLCNVLKWIRLAQGEHFAVGAFNANTMEQVQAIVQAAEEEGAPAIIQVSHRALLYAGSGSATLGLRFMAEIGRVAAQSVSAPLALHLDHGNEAEVMQALALGFTSVMFDGSALPLDENIALTRKLCEAAHAVGVSLEAELGEVPRADPTGKVDHPAESTRPQDAVRFVDETGIDLLAVSIGSVHGVKEKRVTLDMDQLRAIRDVVDLPLVLHGSSGVDDGCIADGIAQGLCKINVATQLSQAYTGAVRGRLAQDSGEVDARVYLGEAREAMKKQVRERIRFFGSAGKA